MRLVPLGVAVVAAALFFSGLGAAPFVDPPEGFHTEIAREMLMRGDFVTPRLDTVRYFDKPPLLYWLIALSSRPGGFTPFAARLWSALAAVGVAGVTAYLGLLLGGFRVGLLAGLMVAANMGVYLFGRFVKPDLTFVFCIMLAFLGFALAYLGRGRWPLALFWGALGLAALAKDLLGAVGPLVAVALFFWLTRERPLRPWAPWGASRSSARWRCPGMRWWRRTTGDFSGTRSSTTTCSTSRASAPFPTRTFPWAPSSS